MTDLGAAFAAALDRGTGPDDDLLFPFSERFRAGHVRNTMTPQEIRTMFRSKRVMP